MSVLGKKWEIKNADGNKSVIDKILANRGLSDPDDLALFLKPDFNKDFHDPYLMGGMDRAVERIEKAIKNKERIIVYGDYDVDGISGCAILVLTLQHLGAEVSYRLPHRLNDGYGLNEKFIDEFKEAGVTLLITVDCGISNAKEVAIAKEKGVETIITDHHQIPQNYPEAAYEVLHPARPDSNYPFKDLTGAGVAFKLAHALLRHDGHGEDDNSLIFALLDLASLGTVADCGPIVGENRLIVKKGLEMLPQTKWEGLKFLQEIAGIDGTKKLSTYNIGYQIAPRINAAGRIDSPYYALQLLIQGGETENAKKLANKLETLNKKRQIMLADAFEEAERRYKEEERSSPDEKMIIHYDKDWHVGIIGLVAGRLSEKYSKPSIILQDFGDYLVASARSPQFFNIVEAITECSSYLDHFGGHAQAAGFSLKKENLKAFMTDIKKYTKNKLKKCDLQQPLSIDCEIKSDELSWETVELIESLEPFGIANERPKFVLKDAEINEAKSVGKEHNHLSIDVSKDGTRLKGIAFNMGGFTDFVRTHRSLDIVFQLERNEWKGRKSLQMKIVDFSDSSQ
ncbi:single-stranded-DNA-specific exonuclease RecJ [Patescibacteria group bacterium]